MSARADWHLPVEHSVEDPFDQPPSLLAPESSQASVDPHRRLAELVKAEARLDTEGITCEIRNVGGVCHCCPVNHAREHTPIARLCRVGMASEVVFTEIEAARRAP